MKVLAKKYNIEKTKKILKKKKLLSFLILDTNGLENSFNRFCGRINFVKFLIKTSVFKQILNFINNKSLFICLDTTKNLDKKFKLQKNIFFIFLKNKIYFLNQFIKLSFLKFSNLFLNIKLSLMFLTDYKVVIKFLKNL